MGHILKSQTGAGAPLLSPVFVCFVFLFAGLGSTHHEHPTTTHPPDFAGYSIHPNGAISTKFCTSGDIFSSSSRWAACVDSTDREDKKWITACISGVMTNIFEETYPCNSGSPYCRTALIYDAFPSQSATQSWSDIWCETAPAPTILYRELPASTTTSSSLSTSTSSSSSGPTSSPTETGTSTKPTTSESPEPTTKPSSKAWIAGAVIGSLVFVGLVAFLGFWFGRRTRKSKQANSTPLQYISLSPLEGQVPQPYVSQSSPGAHTPNIAAPLVATGIYPATNSHSPSNSSVSGFSGPEVQYPGLGPQISDNQQGQTAELPAYTIHHR